MVKFSADDGMHQGGEHMGKKILIVDDNEKNIKLLRFLLRKSGYETLEAENGEEGVRLAKENLPDLILMDIQMPAMDGIEALKILGSEDMTSKIPVIALTSYAMKGDKERLIAEGFDGYVSKPINTKEIIEIVKKYIQD
ncbi:MAG: response regulator [Nitrospirota bacterium]